MESVCCNVFQSLKKYKTDFVKLFRKVLSESLNLNLFFKFPSLKTCSHLINIIHLINTVLYNN